MKLKNVRKIYITLEILIILLALTSFHPKFINTRFFLLLAAVILIVISAYIDYNYWRCPHCNNYIGKQIIRKKATCSYCNKHIDYDEKIEKLKKEK